ncbi:Peroxiredoxin HYR1 [Cyberlindnera fabianii]|uniref:Peroxiredoxin HYR1 n=1 Tax=Cyberlindnera fabianii TaxID=36022 RepID=A0A1V2LAN1_CYBFA|nr:Peroxiredoxin HYR1 [Cyberlindnera fabianii]
MASHTENTNEQLSELSIDDLKSDIHTMTGSWAPSNTTAVYNESSDDGDDDSVFGLAPNGRRMVVVSTPVIDKHLDANNNDNASMRDSYFGGVLSLGNSSPSTTTIHSTIASKRNSLLIGGSESSIPLSRTTTLSGASSICTENIDFYKLEANLADGTQFSFEALRGKYVVVAHIAPSRLMGWQITSLEKIYSKYSSQGVEVVGLPLGAVCIDIFKRLVKAKFRVMQNVKVVGKKKHSVYKFFESGKSDSALFGLRGGVLTCEKYLVDREGNIVKRYSTLKHPNAIMEDLDKLLKEEKASSRIEV